MRRPDLFKQPLQIKLAKKTYSWVAIDGDHGNGKTVLMSLMAYKYQKDYDLICANYHLKLNDCDFEYIPQFTGKYILDLNKRDIGRKLILIDEAHRDFDCRSPVFDKKSRELKDSLFQIRKVDFDLIVNIRDLQYLDFRFVRNASKFFNAVGRIEDTNFFIYQKVGLSMGGIGFDINKVIPYSKYIEDMTNIYDIYDTYEIIDDNANKPAQCLL